MDLPKCLMEARKTCSRRCAGIERSRRMKKFADRECICGFCGKKFVIGGRKKRGRYCSQECFHKAWDGRSKEEKKCLVCGKVFVVTATKKRKKFCSKSCQYMAQSMGMVKSYSRGNYGYRPDLGKTFRSSLEANFARMCTHEGLTWKYESDCFRTKLGFYTPDFWVEEWKSFVELRGFRGRTLRKPLLAARRYGFKLVIIYEDDFLKRWGGLKDRVVGWEDSKGPVFGMIDPAVYEKRICRCGRKFLHRRSKVSVGLYCSIECANKYKWERPHGWHRRERVESKCPVCGVVFRAKERKRFCTRRCYWKSMRNDYVGNR